MLVSLAEELRTLEYGQRLRDRRRNRMGKPGDSIGRTLFEAAHSGGLQASGLSHANPNNRIVLDGKAIELAGRSGDGALDAWIFASGRPVIDEVWVDGKRQVENGCHVHRSPVEQRFAKVMKKLTSL